ncbi:MAG: RrF2 family transcriptional regulator [Thermoanaerobaculaceae bacterium]
MKITNSDEYGLRLAVQLAASFPQALSVSELALREAIPQPLTAKVLAKLRRGGVVHAHRGRSGGYRLASPPDQIRLDRVLACLGQPLFHLDFCKDHVGKGTDCVHTQECAVRPLFFHLDLLLRQFFASITLSELLEKERQIHRRFAQRKHHLLPVWQWTDEGEKRKQA